MDKLWRASGSLVRAVDNVGKQLDKVETLKTSKEKFKERNNEWTAREPYQYEPLPTPTSIRLIKLEPSKKMQKAQQQGKPLEPSDAADDEDDIIFTMQTAELDRNPLFTALSYTWRRQRSAVGAWAKNTMAIIKQSAKTGTTKFEAPEFDEDPTASRKVTCNGREMRVFENLFAALKQLRRKQQGVWLWIDAICINQIDKAEVDAQVRIMGRIYCSAQLVVVWLGESSALALRGLRYLDAMAQSDEPLPPFPLYRSKINIGVTMSDDYRIHFAAITAFHLANRSWHKRVWVVQEVCLARNIRFLDGKYDVDLATILLSSRWCLDKRGRAETELWYTLTLALGTNIFNHMLFLPETLQAREEFAKGNKWTLLEWFQTCKGRSASEGKDFVFGGLSLIKDDCLSVNQHLRASAPTPACKVAEENYTAETASSDKTSTSSQLWQKLAPDSSALIADVFLNATACLLTHEPLEGLLRLSSRHRDKHRFRTAATLRPRDLEAFSGFPSWIPAVGSWTCGLATDLVPPGTASPYAACAIKPVSALPAVPISADGKMLSVNAAIVDTIVSIEYETDVPPDYDELRNLLRFLVRAKGDHATPQNGSTLDPMNAQENQPIGAPRECLLEDVACAMVAGRVVGEPVTPAQAGSWLCESLCSVMTLHITVAEVKLADERKKLEPLEAKAKKRGLGVEHLQTTTAKDKTFLQWREQRAVVGIVEDLIRDIKAELEAVKSSYPHLAWPTESLVVPREQDVAAAELERESSWNRRLEELSLARSASEDASSPSPSSSSLSLPINSSSFSGGYGMLDRAKMSAVDFADHLNDVGYIHYSPPHERFRRIISDECAAFEHASFDTLWWRRICLTSSGRVLLGPRWVDEGDAVVLLPGVSVPFVLTREGADLQREEARIKERLEQVDAGSEADDYVVWACYEPELKARLLEVQGRLQGLAEGEDEHWFLVGEAYVQGMMQSEADVGLEFSTFGLV